MSIHYLSPLLQHLSAIFLPSINVGKELLASNFRDPFYSPRPTSLPKIMQFDFDSEPSPHIAQELTSLREPDMNNTQVVKVTIFEPVSLRFHRPMQSPVPHVLQKDVWTTGHNILVCGDGDIPEDLCVLIFMDRQRFKLPPSSHNFKICSACTTSKVRLCCSVRGLCEFSDGILTQTTHYCTVNVNTNNLKNQTTSKIGPLCTDP